jgi:ribosomal protein S18 acetylase RimI-like enzyme
MPEISYSENFFTKDDLPAVNELLRQLSQKAKEIDYNRLKAVTENGTIIFARNRNGTIIGMATLTIIKKPTAIFGTCEDVVVENNYRGNGIGKRLTELVIKKGEEQNLKYIDLTSRPERTKANSLYLSIGFEKRNTNVYRFTF